MSTNIELDDLRIDTGLSNAVWQRIKSVFTTVPEVKECVLYGSRAKGSYHKASDIDLTLRGEGISHVMLNAIAIQLDDLLLPWKIDLSLLHEIDNHALASKPPHETSIQRPSSPQGADRVDCFRIEGYGSTKCDDEPAESPRLHQSEHNQDVQSPTEWQ